MSDPVSILESLTPADIDPEGVFKYVLIEASITDPANLEKEITKWLVRGYTRAEYHADIYDEVEEAIRTKHKGVVDCQCLGGGRIIHEPAKKYIKVYGYSMGFGRADHEKSKAELLKVFPSYTIETSNEGY